MHFSFLPTQFSSIQSPSFSSPSFQAAAQSFTKFTALFSERFSESLTLLVERYPIVGRVSLKVALPVALVYGVCAIAILSLAIRGKQKKPSTPMISSTPHPKVQTTLHYAQPSPNPGMNRDENLPALEPTSPPETGEDSTDLTASPAKSKKKEKKPKTEATTPAPLKPITVESGEGQTKVLSKADQRKLRKQKNAE